MKSFVKYLLFASFSLMATVAFAQEQQPEMNPEEIAAKEVSFLETELNLNAAQYFYVDSILVTNYRGLFDEYQSMQASGRQNPDTYKYVSEKWLKKNLDALKLVLDDQQYIMYLKHVGKGQEYKRGKDGLYYKKEELEKMKAEAKKKK